MGHEASFTQPTGDGAETRAAARWVGRALAYAIIGTLAVVLALSFAALVFKGVLAAELGAGATLMLVGGGVLGLVGALSSIRGAVLGVQDAPAIILALAGAAIAAGWTDRPGLDLFSTIAMLLATASVSFGATLWCLGRFGLGAVVRYLPYPVIGGFMAGTGWFLFIGALGTMTRCDGQVETLGAVLGFHDPLLWAPGLGVAAALFIAARVLKSWAALPVVIGGAFIAFYAALAVTGVPLDWAAERGLLLGPFPEARIWEALPLATAPRADWGAVLSQAPFIMAAVAMAVVGMLLNLTGAELATDRAADVDRDLRTTGLANLVSGGVGGGSGYIFISLTLLARKFGALDRGASAAAGLACLLTLAFGASLIGVLPVFVFGGVTAYLGADLLFQWLWVERRRLPLLDYAIVVAILIVAATIGFLEGVAAGVFASIAVFVRSCVAAPIVRRAFTNTVRFSTIERPAAEAETLERRGGETLVYQLEGVLFFGTIAKLAGRIERDVAAADPPARRVVIDFEYVQDFDTSTIHGVAKAAGDCRRGGVELALSGLGRVCRSRRVEALAPLVGDGRLVFDTLDDALEWAEERTLADHRRRCPARRADAARLFGDADAAASSAMARYFRVKHIAPGQTLIRQGETSDDIYFLREGVLAVEIADTLGGRMRVGVHSAGTLVGEMALYTDGMRSADVVAVSGCELLRLSGADLARMEEEAPAEALRFHRAAAQQIAMRLRRTNALVGMLKA